MKYLVELEGVFYITLAATNVEAVKKTLAHEEIWDMDEVNECDVLDELWDLGYFFQVVKLSDVKEIK